MPNPPDSEAVTLWRTKFHLNLSASWKRDIDITITDIELWREILNGWHYFDAQGKKHRKAPGIKNLLTEYERLSIKNELRQETLSARSGSSLRKRPMGSMRESEMFSLPKGANGFKG